MTRAPLLLLKSEPPRQTAFVYISIHSRPPSAPPPAPPPPHSKTTPGDRCYDLQFRLGKREQKSKQHKGAYFSIKGPDGFSPSSQTPTLVRISIICPPSPIVQAPMVSSQSHPPGHLADRKTTIGSFLKPNPSKCPRTRAPNATRNAVKRAVGTQPEQRF